MKSILEETAREELKQRISRLHAGCIRQWGKMDVGQMIRHCILWNEMVNDRPKMKWAFIGRIFGRMALKSFISEKPLKRNVGSFKELIVTESAGDIEELKKEWLESTEAFTHYNNHSFVHGFFGPLTLEQVGVMAYRHADHHLTQFGC